ncbi:hypothetical protein NX059_004345 [Plenodomus lindquistii]|nr:hypothetical protein NX059_004345 [Plenodomus lindquistii]
MKRRHNVALSTLLVIGIIFIWSQDQELVVDRSRTGKAIVKTPEKKADLTGSTPISDNLVQSGHQDSVSLAPSASLVESLAPPPPSSELDASAQDPEFPFQRDLDLDIPVNVLQNFATRTPHNYDLNGLKTYAYATFMATRNPSIHDPYFLAIHSLIYRILWSRRSRTSKYPFIVFVGEYVTAEQRTLLAGTGAIVRELASVEWTPNVPGVAKRWKDLFAKLNMWKEVEFQRILFLDADAFPLANIDEMFDIAPIQQCAEDKVQLDDILLDGTSVCEPFVFAGVAQDTWSGTSTEVNVGSIVFTPSLRMHQRLLRNYVKTDKYNCLMAEQAFLNWQFGKEGPFPATTLERKWGGVFPQENEEGMLNVVHEKIWVPTDGWLRKEWMDTWVEMVRFYESDEFGTMRGQDGLADPMK